MLKTRAGDVIGTASGNTWRFLRREQVQDLTGLATATLYEMMSRGEFPRPIRITPRRVAWIESHVAEWQAAKIAAAARAAPEAA